VARLEPLDKFEQEKKPTLIWWCPTGVTGLKFFFLYILGEMHGLERDGSGCCMYTSVSVSGFFLVSRPDSGRE
jgi:hypothetical protein